MNAKILLVPFLAVLAILVAGVASASNLASIDSVTFNDVELEAYGAVNIAGFAGEVVPVRVTFTAQETSEDVKVKVEVYGGREEIVETTGRFNVIEGNTYTKLLSLRLPSELKDTTKNLTMYVRVYDANHEYTDAEKEYVIKMQRESYNFDILSVDYQTPIPAGEVMPVSIVVKNRGMQKLEDCYVKVSIDALGISTQGYLGDLSAVDECDECDKEDAVQKTLYLEIPSNAAEGTYNMDVEVYNKDAMTKISKEVEVKTSVSTTILATVKSQDIKAGETKTYDLIIVNSGDKIKVYNIRAIYGSALDVSVPSVVTVGPESSKTVPITVKALPKANVGTYTFSVDVNGQQIVFGANVTGSKISSSVVALTVVLAIIFIVLLVILIVLLTRKEKPVEEAETSYY